MSDFLSKVWPLTFPRVTHIPTEQSLQEIPSHFVVLVEALILDFKLIKVPLDIGLDSHDFLTLAKSVDWQDQVFLVFVSDSRIVYILDVHESLLFGQQLLCELLSSLLIPYFQRRIEIAWDNFGEEL